MTAFEQSEKESFLLVEFSYRDGDGEVLLRKTDWTSDVEYLSTTWESDPSMVVAFPPNNGELSSEPCNIGLALSENTSDFTQLVSNGEGFPVTTVTVHEVTRSPEGGVATRIDTRFIGEMREVRRNYQGNRNRIVVQVLPLKGALGQIQLGLSCSQFCAHKLGGPGCGIDLSLSVNSYNVTVQSISGYTITTTQGWTTPTDARFFRGYVERGGLAIGIRVYDQAAPATFGLRIRPPARWDGEVVRVVAGCDKTIQTCRSRYSNEDRFAGYGYGMPAYNPVFESSAPVT